MNYNDDEEYYEEEVVEEEVYEEDYYEEEVIEEEVIDESGSEYEEYTIMTDDHQAGASPFDAQNWRQQGLVQSTHPVAASDTFTPRIVPASDTFTPQVVPSDSAPQNTSPTISQTQNNAPVSGKKSVAELSRNFGGGGVQPKGSLQDHLASLAAKRREKYGTGEPTEVTSWKPKPAEPPAQSAPSNGPKITTTTTVTPATAPQTTTIKKKRIIRKKIIRKPDGSTEEIVTVIEPDAEESSTAVASGTTASTTRTTTTTGDAKAETAPADTSKAAAPVTTPGQTKQQVDSGCACIIL